MNNDMNRLLPAFPYDTQYFTAHNWMTQLPVIDALSLAELVLPGAHNAGVDKKASYAAPGISHWAACQTHSFYYQLTHGARALDLRLEYEIGSNGVGTFWFQHNGFRSSRSLENLITSVIRFLQENPEEFIVLDFHQLNTGDQRLGYQEFNRLLMTHLGDRIIPYRNASLTLGQLKRAVMPSVCWLRPNITRHSMQPCSAGPSSTNGAGSGRPASVSSTRISLG